MQVIIFAMPKVGDSLIYMILAQALVDNGITVKVYSNTLSGLNRWYPDFQIMAVPEDKKKLQDLFEQADLLISSTKTLVIPDLIRTHDDLIDKTAWVNLTCNKKKTQFWQHVTQINFNSTILNQGSHQLSGGLFETSTSKLSMVERAVLYSEQRFNCKQVKPRPTIAPPACVSFRNNIKRILIFPYSGAEDKNYSFKGFIKLGHMLETRGFNVIFAGTQREQDTIQKIYPDLSFPIVSFKGLGEMAEYVYESGFVIGNDSGAGHLASLLGIPFITIHKKNEQFKWRPGWYSGLTVRPCFTFKILRGKRIWKPFIKLKDICNFIVEYELT